PGRPRRAVGRRRLRLPEPGSRRPRAARPRPHGPHRLRRDRVPVRPVADRGEAGRRARRRRDGGGRGRHGDRPRRVPLRPLRQGVRRDREGEGGRRPGPPEGDPGDRRARHLRQRAQGVAARDGRRRRLHQDVHRQDQPGLDAARDPVHARGDPRCRGRDRPPRGDEAGRRNPSRQARDPAPLRAVRDARPRLADAGALPLRGVLARERRADADPQAEDRRLPVPRLLHGRLMSEIEHRPSASPAPLEWEYAPAPEARDIVELRERYGLYIGGEVVDPRSGEWFTTTSPADESALAEVAQAGGEDVNLAVGAARAAFEDGWSSLRPAERAKYLFRIARILQERARELAVAESLDGGKPIKESRDVDLPLAAAHFFYYAGWADKLEYAFPNRTPRPLGVAGQIIPWNFPLLMLAWKVAPALACGNTVVLKPAETTPLTALMFADVCRQAELPAGVVNIVTGDGSTGAALVDSDVDKIAFTGSTEVGKAIQRHLAGTGKKLTLELGGKAANIIFDDAALDQAVEGIINGIYFNQGHVCCAGSRLFVQ